MRSLMCIYLELLVYLEDGGSVYLYMGLVHIYMVYVHPYMDLVSLHYINIHQTFSWCIFIELVSLVVCK